MLSIGLCEALTKITSSPGACVLALPSGGGRRHFVLRGLGQFRVAD